MAEEYNVRAIMHDLASKHFVYKRVGTRCRLIGQPAYDIEILDDVRKR